jgi:hypothetical protein
MPRRALYSKPIDDSLGIGRDEAASIVKAAMHAWARKPKNAAGFIALIMAAGLLALLVVFGPLPLPAGLQSTLRTSFWIVPGILSVTIPVLIWRVVLPRPIYRELNRRGHRVCTRCGYPLAELPDADACPECGTPIVAVIPQSESKAV